VSPVSRDLRRIDIRSLKTRVLQVLPPSNAIRDLILGEEDFLPVEEYLVKAECWVRLIQAQGAEFGWAEAVHRSQEKVAVELRASRIEALNRAGESPAPTAKPRHSPGGATA
jgi:hypothetical protein